MTAFWMSLPTCGVCGKAKKHRIVKKAGVWQTVWYCPKHGNLRLRESGLDL